MAESFEKLIDIDSLPEQLKKDAKVGIIASLITEKKLNEAVKQSGVLLSEDSDMLEAWKLRGLANFKLGNYQEALNDFNEALSISPGDYFSHVKRAYTLFFLGKLEEAASEFLASEKLAGRTREDEEVHLYVSAASIYLFLGQNEKSMGVFKKAFEINPRITVSDIQILVEKILSAVPNTVIPAEEKISLQQRVNKLSASVSNR